LNYGLNERLGLHNDISPNQTMIEH